MQSESKESKVITIPKSAFNEAFLPYLRSTARIEIMYGGGGSGKSYFLRQRDLLEIMGKKQNNILLMHKVAASHHNTTFADLCNIIDEWDRKYFDRKLSSYFKINHSKGDERILFTRTGNEILFGGCKDDNELEKIKGIRATNGPITKIRCEEFTNFTEKDFFQLNNVRLRGESIEKKQFTASMNPINVTHWIKKRFFDEALDGTYFYEHSNSDQEVLINNPSVVVLKTTHEDNKFYGEEERSALLQLKNIDKYYYDVYVLGNWGVLGNIVFSNYVIEDFDYTEKDLENNFVGMDYGFVHASAIEKGGFKDDELYVYDELYGKNWTNTDLIDNSKQYFNDSLYDFPITADSAEPDRIEEWNRNGFRVVPAKKGPGSLKYGIDYLCSIPKIHIHKTKCPNLAREITMFKRREDKDGNAMDSFVEINDDTIAALRYGTEYIWSNQMATIYNGDSYGWSLSELGL